MLDKRRDTYMMMIQFIFIQEGSNGILSTVIRSNPLSCSHMNFCLQNILHINLHILYIKDKLKNSRITRIHQVLQKLSRKQDCIFG